MAIKIKLLVASILMILNSKTILGQLPKKTMVSIPNKILVAKSDNYIHIIAQQPNPVSINQISAFFQVYNSEKNPIKIEGDNGDFYIHPDTIGMLEINIKVGDTVERHELHVGQLEAVGQLGIFDNNYDLKISSSKFKIQSGLIAVVECCGFDAKCMVLSYETIRVAKNNEVERTSNKGGAFEEKTRKIIMKAELGDIYIFRQIMSHCPGVSPQRLKDMIFEIE